MDPVAYALAMQASAVPAPILDIPYLNHSTANTPLFAVQYKDDIYYQLQNSATFYKYNLITGVTTTLTASPYGSQSGGNTASAAAVAVGSVLYIVGQAGGPFYAYDTVANTWTLKATHGYGMYDLNGIATDGVNVFIMTTGAVPKKYTVATNVWAAAGSATAGVNISGKTVTGTSNGKFWCSGSGTFSVWDSVSQTTTTKAAPPLAYHSVLLPSPNKIFMISGNSSNSEGSNQPTVYSYDIAANTWTSVGRAFNVSGGGGYATVSPSDDNSGGMVVAFVISQGSVLLRLQTHGPDLSALLSYIASR